MGCNMATWLVHAGTAGQPHVRCCDPNTSKCHKIPPMLVQWNKGCTPYPQGSIVVDKCGCVWGNINPAGEFHPPGQGTWQPVNLALLTAFLIDPEKVMIQFLAASMGCPELTSQMRFKTCDEATDPNGIPECVRVKTLLHSGCNVPLTPAAASTCPDTP